MKKIGMILSLLLSTSAFAEAYWSCQCYENLDSGTSVAGVEFSSRDANSLRSAQKIALQICQRSVPEVTIANCLRFVKTDH